MDSKVRPIDLALPLVFLATLVPLVAAAFYNHPAADDYGYGAQAALAFRSTGSPAAALAAALQTVGRIYAGWQGTFSAAFLFSLQPGIFGEDAYFLGTVLLLAALTLSTAHLLKVLLVDRLGADRRSAILIGTLFLLLTIQCVPDVDQAFFWYNGAVYYTFFHSLAVALAAALLRCRASRPRGLGASATVLLSLLAGIVGGGNFGTALVSALLLSAYAIRALLRRAPDRFRLIALPLSATAGLLVSAFAPGNAVRAAQLSPPLPPLVAIRASFRAARLFAGEFLTVPLAAAVLLALLLLAPRLRASRHRFRWPLLFIAASWCAFAALIVPCMYAMGSAGGGRLQDMYHHAFLWMVLLDAVYAFGWLLRRFEPRGPEGRIRRASAVACLTVCLVGFAALGADGTRPLASVAATIALADGSAARYDAQRDARVRIYLDAARPDVVVRPLTEVPRIFHAADDVAEDPEHWTNRQVAAFYDKRTVVLDSGGSGG